MARSFWGQIQRDLYFASRFAGDMNAAQRGRLGKRLARRYLTRELFRILGRMGR